MDLYEFDKRAKLSVAQGYNSKDMDPSFVAPESSAKHYPSHIKSANGCTVTDVFDRKFVDYSCGHGTNLLGYGDPKIEDAIKKSLNFSAPIAPFALDEEIYTAEKLKEYFPFVDNFKFLSSTKEAHDCAAAIAITETGREKVIYDVNQLSDKVACVIVDPTLVESEKSNTKLLEYARLRCDEVGALLIYDETVSAFRHRYKCVATASGVLPDLIILGGPLGAGMNITAVGGKQKHMNAPGYSVVQNRSTNCVNLAACREFVTQMQQRDLEMLWDHGGRFVKRFNEISEGAAKITGTPTYGKMIGLPAFFNTCAEAGIIFTPKWFFSFALIEESEKTLSIVADVCHKLTQGKKA